MNGRWLHELTRMLNMRGMEPLEGTRLRLVLEGGGESYVLDAEESEAGLLLGLGVALAPHEQDDAALLAAAARAAQQAGLRALRQEGRLYFAATVPALHGAGGAGGAGNAGGPHDPNPADDTSGTSDAGALHRQLENCLNCHRQWRRNT